MRYKTRQIDPLMKFKIALILGVTSACTNAATSFSGIGVSGAMDSAASGYVAAGSLALLIVDIDNDGFLNMGPPPLGWALPNYYFDPGLPRFLGSGQLFGNDRIVTVTTTGVVGTIDNLLPSQNITAFLGKNFAVVWFDGILTASAPAEAPEGSHYGIIHGNDWTFPLADVNGSIAFNATDSLGSLSFWRVSGGDPSHAAISQSGFMSTNGYSGTQPVASSFVPILIPEPTVVMLGSLGVLGCLRRRRN
jgi:hypothetical protein